MSDISADTDEKVTLFAVGLRRQARCRLGVPCVMQDCGLGIPPEDGIHFFAPDGNIYPPTQASDSDSSAAVNS